MCHLGWLHDNTHTDLSIYGKGITDDPLLQFCHRYRYVLAVASMIVLPAVWALVFGGPEHVIGTILIGGCLRCFIFSNGVASNNSLAHTFGYRHFKDERSGATSNWFSTIITLSDGWHNAHHESPRIASNKVAWWEFDFNGSTIHLMEKLGLAWNVQRRSAALIASVTGNKSAIPLGPDAPSDMTLALVKDRQPAAAAEVDYA